MTGICGACGHAKSWTGPSHEPGCLVPKAMADHPSNWRSTLPDWFRDRYLIDDHDQRFEELREAKDS